MVRKRDALAGAGQDHAVVADHRAAAQRGKADRSRLAHAGMAVAHPHIVAGREMPRPAAAASPSSNAVPDGASTLCL